MAEKRRMVIEVHADMSPYLAQVRAGVAAGGGTATVPVGSPVGATVAAAGSIPGVPAVLAGGTSAATQTAVAAALQQAQTAAAQYAMPMGASSPNWSALMQQSVTAAMFPTGASSPNWSYLMAGQARGGRTPGAPGAARGGAGFLSGAGLVRTLIASELLAEGSNALQISRQSQSDAMFARTDEDRGLIYAQAAERLGNGVIGRAVTFPLDLFDAPISPARMLREATDAVRVRRSQDDIRTRRLDIADAGTVRSAYASGGQSAATAARAEAQANRQIADLEIKAKELSSNLQRRTPTSRTLMGDGAEYQWVESGGEFELTGQARDVATADLRTVNDELRNARAQARFDANRRLEDVSDARRGTLSATQRANLIAGGASARDVDRFDLGVAGTERAVAGFRNRGFAGGLEEIGRLGAERGAMDEVFGREDRRDIARSRSFVLADTYRAQGNFFQGDLVQMRAGIEADATREGIGEAEAARIRAEGAAKIADMTARQNRALTSNLRGLSTQSRVLQAHFANNPLGAQIAAIRGQREEDLSEVTDTGLIGGLQRGFINFNAGMQERLAQRNFDRARSDVNLRLSGAIERAQLGIGGGPSRFIRQDISGIVEQNEADVRGMIRNGMTEEAGRRRELGGLQLRQAESEFYRSVQYREASPRGVFGTGTLGDVRGAFDSAQAAVSRSGAGEATRPATSQDIKDLGLLLERIFRDGISATAG